MTSFITLLKRDLRLQVPMMLIYSAMLVLIAGGFTWLTEEVNAGAYGFLLFLFIAQFILLNIALPINAIWREWRMKTVAHWLMLPASVHKKIWSKTVSVVIWTLYIAILVSVLWAITGLIGQTVIHTGTMDLVMFILNSDLVYVLPAIIIYLVLGTFPYFLGVIMVKGEGGIKGPIFAGFILFFFVVIYPLLTVYNPLSLLEIGPIYMDLDITQGEFSFSDSDFSFSATGDSSEPFTYITNLIFDLFLYVAFYLLSWWYLARKVEI